MRSLLNEEMTLVSGGCGLDSPGKATPIMAEAVLAQAARMEQERIMGVHRIPVGARELVA
ncbi:hypothetical protein Brsp05_04050 [Brucella sp. NBRC 12953]